FKQSLPGILGAMLDAVSMGLKRLSQVKLREAPRMADFARWIVACEPALPCKTGGFLKAFNANQLRSTETAIESSPIVMPIRELLEEKPNWEGTATDLLSELQTICGLQEWQKTALPKSPNALSGRLKRDQKTLVKMGILVTYHRGGRDGTRTIRL